ncbi:hypothetical protein EC917_107182 [Bacillus thuringiensis]|uniref:Uncharacterized protein n=1 Tax=Bacillus thuringiensis TaxID=1428 RepID=A0A4R4BFP9_BACTU|nr:hypothetical protein EC917_107182 [Bacillus thuringiensis]TCW55091.1 hypothetical protein EC910_107182 [Bacillus thuringiensis]
MNELIKKAIQYQFYDFAPFYFTWTLFKRVYLLIVTRELRLKSTLYS